MTSMMKLIPVEAPARDALVGGAASDAGGGFQDVLSQVKRGREPAQATAGAAEGSAERSEAKPAEPKAAEAKDASAQNEAGVEVEDDAAESVVVIASPAAVQIPAEAADEVETEGEAGDEAVEARPVVVARDAKPSGAGSSSQVKEEVAAVQPMEPRGRAEALQQDGSGGKVSVRGGEGEGATDRREMVDGAASERAARSSSESSKAGTGVERAPVRGEAGQTNVPAQASPSVIANSPDATDASNARPVAQVNTPAEARPAAPAAVRADLPDVRFAEQNAPNIVTAVRTQLLPNGGSMQIRLDPPELGAMQVIVRMRDGAMTAMFQTSSDEAARLLSHNLNNLRQALETAGMHVERLQVQQSPREEGSSRGGQQEQSQQQGQQGAQQEQQRREMLQRMWRKLALGDDALDLVA